MSDNGAAQVLSIAAVRPASLTAFFQKQQTLVEAGQVATGVADLLRLLAQALPSVLHSLQARTGNPDFPASFKEWLVMSCVAAAVKCADAVAGDARWMYTSLRVWKGPVH